LLILKITKKIKIFIYYCWTRNWQQNLDD